jgi:hypothetical protein
MKNLKNKQAQAFSIDVIVVIVVVLFVALFLILVKINGQKNENLEVKVDEVTTQSKLIVNELKSNNVIDNSDSLDVAKLSALDLEKIKEQLKIKNDFAIVLEKDGKLIKIDPSTNVNCVGSSLISVNGVACQ